MAKGIASNPHLIAILLHDAIRLVAQAGFDPEFGARPVKRALQRLLLNDLSRTLLAGTVDRTRPIEVGVEGDHLAFKNE